MIRHSYLAAATMAGVMLASAAIAQAPTSPTPTMSNNPGAAATTDPGVATDPGMSPATPPGNDVMATPASPDSSMSKGATGRRHMKPKSSSTAHPVDPAASGMGNTTAPQ